MSASAAEISIKQIGFNPNPMSDAMHMSGELNRMVRSEVQHIHSRLEGYNTALIDRNDLEVAATGQGECFRRCPRATRFAVGQSFVWKKHIYQLYGTLRLSHSLFAV